MERKLHGWSRGSYEGRAARWPGVQQGLSAVGQVEAVGGFEWQDEVYSLP